VSDLLSKVRRSDDKSADTIAQRFERRVASISDRLAIVTDEVSLTYRALDLMASRIAGGLASLSFQTEKPVVLLIKDEVTRLAAMLAALKANRIFILLAPTSPQNGKHRIPRTVETMAANYVAEIRRVQPHGPYFIAGHSFGGLLSFEIAQQLVRAGERVSFLGLIDTGLFNAPGVGRPELSRGPRVSQQLFAFFERLLWIREVIWKRWYVLKLRAGQPVRYDHRPIWYDWLCCRASRNYVPKPYTGHITMFSSAGNSERQAAHWGPLAGHGLTMLEVPATHDDIVLPPHSKLLARHFDDCLDKAEKDFIAPVGP